LLKRKPAARSAAVASLSSGAGKGEDQRLLAFVLETGLAGKRAAAERRPLAHLLRIAGAGGQRQQSAIEGIWVEREEPGLVDEAARLNQFAGARLARLGFEFGFGLGEAGLLLFVGAQAIGERAGH
jgi:hypothetical protein